MTDREEISLQKALEEQEYNAKLADKQPEKQAAFAAEYMYADPSDFAAMAQLYEVYGYKYSRSLWALQQMSFEEASNQDELDKKE